MSGLMIFSNNAATTLASGITNVATSLTVASGAGSLFPNPTGGQYFYMTLANTAGIVEIVKVTARSTDVFTIVRGQDNTAAVSWNSGDKVELRLVNASLVNLGQLDSTNTWTQAQTFSGGLSGALTGNVTGNVSGTAATITGVNTIAHGGTNNASLGVTAGGVVYTDGSALQNTGAGTSGQVLTSNGSSAPSFQTISASGRLLNVQYFTTAGTATYTPTSGTNSVIVEVVGGGGGSGTSSTAGGTTSFGALISATGGSANGGNAGSGSGGDLNGTGTKGPVNSSPNPSGFSTSISQNGASGFYGFGAGGGASLTIGANQTTPQSISGGSSGGYAMKKITSSFSGVTVTVGAAGTGGSGATSGIVIVYEYA